tara:strand:- start:1280 stop:1870 length:591 start_codon:yes stop_codon:yes gene_type:complete
MILKSLIKLVTLGVAAVFLTSTAQAEWSLVNDSSTLSFVTIKADHVAEVHTFDLMTGSIDDDGAVEIIIELASVNTLIDIRNERMQNMLFETSIFPEARIIGNIDVATVTAMPAGSTRAMQISFELDIHGESNSYNADVLVTRLANGAVASTVKPILVSADAHGMVSGVEALREVAGLPSISRAVPVTFTVVFDQD